MVISIIAAMARGRVIGYRNQIPWYLPADFKHFKEITMGKPIVMGRKTYESIGRPLPGRRNIILSHNLNLRIKGCEVVHSLEEALDLLANEKEIFIIGGAHLFAQTLSLAHRLYFTLIEADFEGDTYFPEWHDDWQEISRESFKADSHNIYNYSFITLTSNN